MTSVHVLTAIDQNFLLNSKGETFILGNVKGMKFTEKKKIKVIKQKKFSQLTLQARSLANN